MGAGIAQVAAANGHLVYLYDTDKAALETACQNIKIILDRKVEKGSIKKSEAGAIIDKIVLSTDIKKFVDCALVIEAVVENLKIKQKVFENLEAIVDADALLATNTSSLSITSIGSAVEKRDRFLGLHFFNPAPVMPLVEIITGLTTSGQTVGKACDLLKSWGKTTVLAKDTPGFIVNRIGRPFYGEALRIMEEGIADAATIDWAMKEIGGFRMGPFELMDLIGNDVNYKVSETVFEAFYYDPRFKPSQIQKRMVEANFLGKKTGKGFYEYGNGAVNPSPVTDIELGEKIVQRILAMLINEAADAVFLNVATPSDIDIAMTKGVNYPRGLLEWADEIGLDTILKNLTDLQDEYGEDRYRPNPLIKRMVKRKEKFY
ncbi:3-hydroxybutyryl-CoA dehydrogenase [candidate division KSB1 bacterium]|nr:3-hydroxybutyryl-CoA dehydrogenase [candidate division KSB1 bacterium]